MAAIGGNVLPPLPLPSGPLAPEWAVEAVRRLNLITGAQSGNEQLFSFGENNANINMAGSGVSGPTTIVELITIIQAQSATIRALQTNIDGASIAAACNGDGTITVTLTWG